MEEKYTLELNVVKLNTIIKGLQKLPYEESATLIKEIINVVTKQQVENEKAAKAVKEKK